LFHHSRSAISALKSIDFAEDYSSHRCEHNSFSAKKWRQENYSPATTGIANHMLALYVSELQAA
jgi:hypothetical protein